MLIVTFLDKSVEKQATKIDWRWNKFFWKENKLKNFNLHISYLRSWANWLQIEWYQLRRGFFPRRKIQHSNSSWMITRNLQSLFQEK